MKKVLDEAVGSRYASSMNTKKEYVGGGVRATLDFDNLKDYSFTTWAIQKGMREMLQDRYKNRNSPYGNSLKKAQRETIRIIIKTIRMTNSL